MKNILILTDFSANAMHAALTGTMLAKQLHASILLFNSNTTQAVAPVYAGGPTVIDEVDPMWHETKEKLQKLADSLEPYAETGDGEWKPAIHYEHGFGALGYQVKNLIDKRTIEMVVMGAREGSRIDHFLTGSETFSVIDHVNRPVLVIPNDTDLTHLKRVIFATNFTDADIKAIQYLSELGHVFNYIIEIVHINPYNDEDITREVRKKEFLKHLHRLGHHNINVSALGGKDIVDRLNRLCDGSGTELLAFTHYRDSIFTRLFHKSTTRHALAKQKVPMLIFPSDFHF